ncbi:ATP-dependent RNA helicase mss116, mitochondrial [Aspergillus lentulus]|uniref:DEAD/DEAH box helicase n=1 Tax=Aspergillus lentulus TaxID=293939 RepID=UPI0013954743|nr:ATP-dependent RNA helicase mss116, mitochondrial [Aspergillus lentulus]GFF42112.1 ATP-dependent RNA helicase mss116, mitochondrial [Aspergillus lentulus]
MMLGAVRRYGVVHALRASVPRAICRPSNSQLLRCQTSPVTAYPQSVRLLHESSPFFSSASAQAQAQPDDFQSAAPLEPLREFTDLAEQGLVDPKIIRAIVKDMQIKTMTDVQSQTLREILQGDDVLAQAKTGTGKTLAFLTPVFQNIMKDPSLKGLNRRRSQTSSSDIRAIIISPTRELAEQIAVEARRLAAHSGVIVQTAVGGTQKREGLRRIQREGCHVLIGTPGRLKDVLSDSYNGVTAPNLSTLVLDEADRLLDDGFSEDIIHIQRLLPDPMKVDRQTLMFSATVPREVMRMVRKTMKPNFKFVKTVRDDEVPTHLTVPQKYVVLRGYENAMPALLEFVTKYVEGEKENPNQRPFKAIVYFNSTSQTNLVYETFRNIVEQRHHPLRRVRVYEIHSQLTQARRTRSSDFFRAAKSAILFSSDVTARGMDFPDVTHVIQVSIPRDRATYIHRLGRTARANKTGEGWVLTHRGELPEFDRQLEGIPLNVDKQTFTTATVDMSKPELDPESPATRFIKEVKDAVQEVPEDLKRRAYMAQIGPLRGYFARKRDLIQAINDCVVHGYGLPEPPQMSPTVARNLGLDRVPGVRVADYRGSSDDMSTGRDYRGRGGDRDNHASNSRRGRGFNSDRREFNSDRRESRFGNRRNADDFSRGRRRADRDDY